MLYICRVSSEALNGTSGLPSMRIDPQADKVLWAQRARIVAQRRKVRIVTKQQTTEHTPTASS